LIGVLARNSITQDT